MMSLVIQLKEGFDKIFDEAKETIICRRIIKSWDSEDDISESPSDTSIEGVIQIIELEDIEEFGGLLQVGDAQGFFESATDVQKGDRIQHNSIWYEIDRIIPERTAGSLIFNHAFLKRIEYL